MPPPTPRRRTPGKNANTSIFTFQAPSIRIPTFNSPIKRPKTPTAKDVDGAQTRDEARQARLRGPAGQTWNNLNTLLTRGPTKLPSFSAAHGANSRAARAKIATPGRLKNPKTLKKTPKTPSRAESTKKSARKSSVAAKTRVVQPIPRSATRSAAVTTALKTRAAAASSAGPKSSQRKNGKRVMLPSSPLHGLGNVSDDGIEAIGEVEEVDEPVQVEAPPPPEPPVIVSTSTGKTKAPPKQVPAKKALPAKVSKAVAIRQKKRLVEDEGDSDDSDLKVVERPIKQETIAKNAPSSPPRPTGKLGIEEVDEPMPPVASSSHAIIKAPSKRPVPKTKATRVSKAVAVRQQNKRFPDAADQDDEDIRIVDQPIRRKPVARQPPASRTNRPSPPSDSSSLADVVATLRRPSKHTNAEDLDGSASDSSFDDGPVVKRRKSSGPAWALDKAKKKPRAPNSLDVIFAGVRSKMVEKMATDNPRKATRTRNDPK